MSNLVLTGTQATAAGSMQWRTLVFATDYGHNFDSTVAILGREEGTDDEGKSVYETGASRFPAQYATIGFCCTRLWVLVGRLLGELSHWGCDLSRGTHLRRLRLLTRDEASAIVQALSVVSAVTTPIPCVVDLRFTNGTKRRNEHAYIK